MDLVGKQRLVEIKSRNKSTKFSKSLLVEKFERTPFKARFSLIKPKSRVFSNMKGVDQGFQELLQHDHISALRELDLSLHYCEDQSIVVTLPSKNRIFDIKNRLKCISKTVRDCIKRSHKDF
ncbi:unnamed protein product [Moneuplotes crassus]|uniref:Uncharacterized protein n=1 Tax=Euplotes crassus TaxID=5936 RepID=A0AAD1Y6J0_EUPCR|nr:unnamed protein product [Moneuplotes crassus]